MILTAPWPSMAMTLASVHKFSGPCPRFLDTHTPWQATYTTWWYTKPLRSHILTTTSSAQCSVEWTMLRLMNSRSSWPLTRPLSPTQLFVIQMIMDVTSLCLCAWRVWPLSYPCTHLTLTTGIPTGTRTLKWPLNTLSGTQPAPGTPKWKMPWHRTEIVGHIIGQWFLRPTYAQYFRFTNILPTHAQFLKNHHRSSFWQSYAQCMPNILFRAHIPNTCPIW